MLEVFGKVAQGVLTEVIHGISNGGFPSIIPAQFQGVYISVIVRCDSKFIGTYCRIFFAYIDSYKSVSSTLLLRPDCLAGAMYGRGFEDDASSCRLIR